MRRRKWLLVIFFSKTKYSLWFVLSIFCIYCSIGVSIADEMVCGKLNGYVVEVLRRYLHLPPEYEGKSAWEGGFIHNKTGCDADLVSLSMVMTWPEMMPANRTAYLMRAHEFEGLSVHLEPLRRSNGDLRYRLERRLEKTSSEDVKKTIFLKELDLYFVRGNDRIFTESLNGYYWREEEGGVPIVFECLWSNLEKRFYTCEGTFAFAEVGSLVEVRFTPEKIKEWKEIVGAIKGFILLNLRDKE